MEFLKYRIAENGLFEKNAYPFLISNNYIISRISLEKAVLKSGFINNNFMKFK